MPVTHWNGTRIAAEITVAAMLAVNETTQAAADEAERDHWWHERRGMRGLEGQTINARARRLPGGVIAGKFGTTRKKGFYGLFLEYRHPFLRPVADRVFPTLGARLSEKVREIKV